MPDLAPTAPRSDLLTTPAGAAIPTHWYNLAADLPEPAPPAPPSLHPGTQEPLGPEDLAPLFPMALIAQEASTERYIEILQTVRETYALWRLAPLVRAHRLERPSAHRPRSTTSTRVSARAARTRRTQRWRRRTTTPSRARPS